MNRVLLGVALAALSLPLTAALPPVHADGDTISYDNTNYATTTRPTPTDDSAYPYQGQSGYTRGRPRPPRGRRP